VQVTNKKYGTVKCTTHYRGWIALNISYRLKSFPFDYHDLRILFRSHKRCITDMRLMLDTTVATIDTGI
jgi:hypothetical protein